ncbi:MAG: glutathione S-transferase N-terminal domain-containing protein, partial [Terriglobales bacterium]
MSTKLYYAPGACSLASHIALEEVGIAYETERLNLAEGDQRKPEYLRLNPRGRVPTLVVDGHVMTENVGILAYLGGGYPRTGIWPTKTWDHGILVSTMA